MHSGPLNEAEAESFASLCTTTYQNHLVRQRSSLFVTLSLGRFQVSRTEIIDAVEAWLGRAPLRCAIQEPHQVAELELASESQVRRILAPGIFRIRGRALPIRRGQVPLVTWMASGFPGWIKDDEASVLLESLVPRGPNLWNIRRMHYITERGSTVTLDSFLFEVLGSPFPVSSFYICGHKISLEPLGE